MEAELLAVGSYGPRSCAKEQSHGAPLEDHLTRMSRGEARRKPGSPKDCLSPCKQRAKGISYKVRDLDSR